MPELPEVEIARRNVVRWWEGRSADQVVVLDEKLLVETDADELVEAMSETCETFRRRGKYLIAEMADRRDVVFHFRMTGKIVCGAEAEPEYARLSWHVPESGWLAFVDMRRLGRVRLLEEGEIDEWEPLAEMGPEPLEVTGDQLRELLPPNRLLKTSLMDQRVVAGLGNIAISEIFWRARLHPRVKSGELTDEEVDELAEIIPAYLEEIIEREESDEITYVEEDQESNPFEIYRRDECPRCGAEVEKMNVGGRSTYYCGACQTA
mgnify:CR=1 FL=1